MKNIGLFFGSFNPIHLGHLAIADFFVENSGLEEIWLVISPQSPFKEKNSLMENKHRLAMVEMAIVGKPKLKACSEEFDLSTPNYTVDTLGHLKKKYPKNNKTEDIVLEEEQNFMRGFLQIKRSPRKLAIALQAKIKEKSKNKDLNRYSLRR